jgi:4a-hydroxytetrahydrobiopterin dehydratase
VAKIAPSVCHRGDTVGGRRYGAAQEARMSEQGWREFLAADDLDDWVVLHGGAMAVFRSSTLASAASLATAVGEIPELAGSEVLLTVGEARLTVRLARGVFRLEERHVAMARAVSAVVRRHGGVADRSAVHEVSFAIAAQPDDIDVGFWRAATGYSPLAEDNAIDPLGHCSTVWLQELDPAKPLRHAMHMDVSVPREEVEARVAAAVAAGGRVVDSSRAPGWTLVADRAGNKFCICAWPDGAPWPWPEEDPGG